MAKINVTWKQERLLETLDDLLVRLAMVAEEADLREEERESFGRSVVAIHCAVSGAITSALLNDKRARQKLSDQKKQARYSKRNENRRAAA